MESTEHQDSMKTDHARWSSQHGHWLKDTKVWRNQHLDLIDAFHEIEKLIRRVDRDMTEYEHEVKIHEDEVRIHRAIELAGKAAGSKSMAEELEEVHNDGFLRHKAEEQHHEAIKFQHENIASKVATLGDMFGSERDSWFDS